MKKIGFVGLGKLGLPCAEAISKKKYDVRGYDVNKVKSNKIKVLNSIKKVVESSEIVFIAVPTPHIKQYDGSLPTSHLTPKDFNYDIVKKVLKEINHYSKPEQIVVLISTVLPGIVRSELSKLITNNYLVYNPYLIAMGSVAWDMLNPEMIIMGNESGKKDNKIKKLLSFYKTIIENKPRYEFGTWDEAECIKIFYNTFISAKIILVNMIQDVSLRLGNINVDVVTDALKNSTQRIMGPKYMTAGMGDGGACHPRDNIALRFLAKKLNLGYDLFDAIMDSREKQAKNMAKYLVNLSKKYKLKICIHGKAYKPDVPYLDGSYSTLVGSFCAKLGKKVTFVDPYFKNNIKSFKGVILLAHNSKVTYPEKNIKNRLQYKQYCEFKPGSIVVDPWRRYTTHKKIKVIYYGNTR